MPTKFDAEAFVAHKREIDLFNVAVAMSQNADFLGFYGAESARWEFSVADIKLEIRVREAEVAEETRRELGKATEGVVTSKISLDADWQRLNRRLNNAKEQLSLYEMAVKTMVDRGNNARSMSARSRVEIEQLGGSTGYVPSGRTPEESKELLRSLGK